MKNYTKKKTVNIDSKMGLVKTVQKDFGRTTEDKPNALKLKRGDAVKERSEMLINHSS